MSDLILNSYEVPEKVDHIPHTLFDVLDKPMSILRSKEGTAVHKLTLQQQEGPIMEVAALHPLPRPLNENLCASNFALGRISSVLLSFSGGERICVSHANS